jgi:hypothetical protein
MADSKLLKEAIADAKAVRRTAIENARIALEEAFTPKLQSLLSQKLQAEMEGDDEMDNMDVEEMEMDDEELDEELDSSDIGKGEGSTESGLDGSEPEGHETHTELDPETASNPATVGSEDDNTDVVDDLHEEDADDDVTGAQYDVTEYDEEADEDELDLEAIIRELEDEMETEDEPYATEDEIEEDEEFDIDLVDDEDEMEGEEELSVEMEDEESLDDEIDLEEILREMGYEDEEVEEDMHDDNEVEMETLRSDLGEAYRTIKELRSTINETNLMNAKLLYVNKLFRSYELNNSQKMKIVESIDRTSSVREVKLVYATLAESMTFSKGIERKRVKKLTEGFASTPTQSTKPKTEIIQENTNELANRFKKLAGINKY